MRWHQKTLRVNFLPVNGSNHGDNIMIFGNNGKNMIRAGIMDMFSDGTTQSHVGDSIFSQSGISHRSGNTLFHENGKGISMKTENRFMTPKGTWTRSGNMLFGPNGQTFFGVISDDDAWSIINKNT